MPQLPGIAFLVAADLGAVAGIAKAGGGVVGPSTSQTLKQSGQVADGTCHAGGRGHRRGMARKVGPSMPLSERALQVDQ